ncbi:MAG: type VII secretion protein EccCa [Pseudolysinimonas sp.]
MVHRPARVVSPTAPPEERMLAAPPPLGAAQVGGFPLQSLLPVVGSMSSITMMLVFRSNPILMVVGAMVLVVALVGGVGMALSSRGREARTRRRARERYLDYLEETRAELRTDRDRVREAAVATHPEPARLPSLVGDPARLWERRPTDVDFARARIGSGVVPWFRLAIPEDPDPVQPADPTMATEAANVCAAARSVPGLPAIVDLTKHRSIAIVGPAAVGRRAARALVAQLAVWHAPDDVLLAFAIPPEALDAWTGIELLPHAQMPERWDGPIRARRIAADANELAGLVRDEFAGRLARSAAHRGNGVAPEALFVAVIDSPDGPVRSLTPIALPGVVTVAVVGDRLDEPGDTTLRITVDDDGSARIETIGDDESVPATIDDVSPALLADLSSRLAPLRLSVESRSSGGTLREVGALELLGVDQVEQIGPAGWHRTEGPDFLRVPVGTDDSGAELFLDLKESAQGGMGPHGICIGATGSGKSEFLRTLLLSLAVRHSPEDLALILVDYKGGAAFSPFQPLPHLAGLIDNLEGEAGLIERARASINGEVVRRQRQLRDLGGFDSISAYRIARRENPSMPPMPHLFLVIDEFGELLTAEPEFIDLLLTIGRIGRSIGVHMLLSSQRIEGGRLRGLDSYLSYRVGLRTFSEQESNVVLNTPDAFTLPPIPGYGYLKVDTSVYTRFKSGYVAGAAPGPVIVDNGVRPDVLPLPVYNTLHATLEALVPAGSLPRTGPPLIDQAVARLATSTKRAAGVWLPPLPDRVPLFQVLDGTPRTGLEIPIGLLDDPAHQHQGDWVIDLSRSGGHHAIIGAPQSGRTTMLRTIAAGIATTLTPAQVAVYGLDLAGAGLARLEAFPHVGGVATRNDGEAQTRLLEELVGMLSAREKLFREKRVESVAEFRALHAAGGIPKIVSADVVLLVDGFGASRTDFESLEPALAELLTRGGSYGIHVVASLTRWAEMPMRMQPLIGNRYELRLNDPTESTIARRLSATITQPGRVLTEGELFAQVALPSVDDVPDERLGEALAELAARTAAAWSGPSAAPIRRLPELLEVSELPDEFDEPERIPIGLREDTMEPALLDLDGRDQHLLVLGDPESGKTSLLELIVRGLVARSTAEELVIALMEPRGRLAAGIPDDMLGGHAGTGLKARELASAVAVELESRQAGGTGPRIVVIADDLDILSAGGATPLDPLLPYLPQARDLGLHLIVTRPVAGSARALFESALQSLKDLGATGVLLSGERSEGQLWPGIWAAPSVPGRARLLRRGEPPRQMQLAFPRPTEVAIEETTEASAEG